jgi:hypothetical protein
MSITAVFNNVKAAFDLVCKDRGIELLAHELGADHLSDAQTAPAITWVPRGATKIYPIAGPRAPTAVRLKRPAAPPSGNPSEQDDTSRVNEPGMYASREEMIDIHVWDKTFEASEALLNHLVACMRIQLTGFSFTPVSTDWTLGQEQKSKGYNVCIFTCIVKVPFTFEPQKVATYPLTLELTGEIEEPTSH